jgi:uncharacterized protein YceK
MYVGQPPPVVPTGQVRPGQPGEREGYRHGQQRLRELPCTACGRVIVKTRAMQPRLLAAQPRYRYRQHGQDSREYREAGVLDIPGSHMCTAYLLPYFVMSPRHAMPVGE